MAEKSRKQLVDRCLQVQQILAARRQIKVAELAEKLGVTYDMVNRDAASKLGGQSERYPQKTLGK